MQPAPGRQRPSDISSHDIEYRGRASYGQRSLMLMEHYRGGGDAINITRTYRIRGRLNREAFDAALSQLVARHEILRTIYEGRGPRLRQLVLPSTELAAGFTDVSTAEDPRTAAGAVIAETSSGRFDVRTEPPVRATLITEAPDLHYVTLAVHHIATDLWSDELMWAELLDAYRSIAAGEQAELELPAWQYRHFTDWQHDRLGNESGRRMRNSWEERLRGASLFEPPAGSDQPTGEHRWCGATVEGADLGELRAACQRQRVTPFMVAIAATALGIARTLGVLDVSFATMLANRMKPEARTVLGFCANLIVLRVELEADSDFTDVLGRARSSILHALQYQEMPYHLLSGTELPRGDPSKFRVQLLPDGVAQSGPRIDDGIELVPATAPGSARDELDLLIAPSEKTLEVKALYGHGMIDAEWLNRLVAETCDEIRRFAHR